MKSHARAAVRCAAMLALWLAASLIVLVAVGWGWIIPLALALLGIDWTPPDWLFALL